MSHHAWTVIDGKHVIDTTFIKNDKFTQYITPCKQGKYRKFNREILARWLYEHKTLNLPFKDKYCYGKVDGQMYIGVVSSRNEALHSYKNLLKKIPSHPDYVNVKKETGQNELMRIYYKKYDKR